MTDGAATTVEQARRAPTRKLAMGLARVAAPALAIWLVAGAVLAQVTGRVVDWIVMTDELLYERLALSVARTGSLLPHVHGELIPNGSQLYPVLIAPFFRNSLVPEALHDVHVFNAFLMTSAAVPAYLLARRVTGSLGLATGVAFLSVAMPWSVYATQMLTEVVAYPAFLWAVLAIQRAVALPRPRNDALALLAIALASVARTQFVVLLAVLPLAVLAHRLARRRTREAISEHRLLVAAYGSLAVAGVAVAATGGLARVLGTYATAAEGDVVPPGIVRSLAEHFAALAIGVAVLPFLASAGWLLARLVRPRDVERSAFAAVGTLTLLVMTFEVSAFDLRFTQALVSERYLFYVLPIVLAGLAASLVDPPWPRWALAAPVLVLVVGFSGLPLPSYEKLSFDRPLAVTYDGLVAFADSPELLRPTLVVGAVVGGALLLFAASLLRRRLLAALLAAMVLVALPAQAAAVFTRLFSVDGTSGRPVTLEQGVVFNWIDRTLGPAAEVTAVAYPMIPGDFWAGTAYWWDIEFWNASVTQAATVEEAFSTTPSTFPKLDLRLDARTGRANVTATPYVAQAAADARFRIAGRVVETAREVYLIEAARPWRAEWLTSGLYADGWTRADRPARIRVFASPDQRESVTRFLTVIVRAPGDVASRPFRLASGIGEVRGDATADATVAQVNVCVPAGGYTDVSLEAEGSSTIYGEAINALSFEEPRQAGIFVIQMGLADEVGAPC